MVRETIFAFTVENVEDLRTYAVVTGEADWLDTIAGQLVSDVASTYRDFTARSQWISRQRPRFSP